MMDRIVVTGVGILCAAGHSFEEFAQSLRFGQSGVREIRTFDTSRYAVKRAGVVQLPLERGRRATVLALQAAAQALQDARLSNEDLAASGVCLGTGASDIDDVLAERDTDGSAFCLSLPGKMIADTFRLGGPVFTITTACASGANAIGLAADLIRDGLAEVMLCGGTDAVSPFLQSGFESLRALSSDIRPFDRDRSGMILGEAGAVLVLESESRAKHRNARILAVICGYGLSNDAYHVTQPNPTGQGAAEAIRRCLRNSGLTPDQIDYVNAHGTGTELNDQMEAVALQEVFGDGLARLYVSSTKPIHGHCLGAGGAVEAVACIAALTGQFVPPTVGLCNPISPPMGHVTEPNFGHRIRTVISNSFAFFGNNAVLGLQLP